MRGSPLIRALIAFVVLAALGWPLWQLTYGGSPALAAPEVKQVTAMAKVRLALSFTAAPHSVKILHLNQQIWSSSEAPAFIEQELEIPWPEEGVDLRFQIAWPEDAPLAAARVRLTGPDGEDYEKSIFSEGPADDVLTFP